jgi:hypothetical protein
VQYLEHISLQFDKPTTYLSIPLKKLRSALQNETHRVNIGAFRLLASPSLRGFMCSLCLLKCLTQSDTNALCVPVDILQEVNEVAHGLARRLEQLAPLLGGGYVFQGGQTRNSKQEKPVKDGETCNGDIAR